MKMFKCQNNRFISMYRRVTLCSYSLVKHTLQQRPRVSELFIFVFLIKILLPYLNSRFTDSEYKVYIRSGGADWATATATAALRTATAEPPSPPR